MRRIAMLAMVTLGLGCATAEHIHMVESEYFKGEDFTDYKSYAWIPSDAHRHAETQAEDHRLHDLIRGAIDARLAEQGFVRTQAPDADFLVTYHCKISKALRADLIDHTWYTTGEEGNWEAAPRRVEAERLRRGLDRDRFCEAGWGAMGLARRRSWAGLAGRDARAVEGHRRTLRGRDPGRVPPAAVGGRSRAGVAQRGEVSPRHPLDLLGRRRATRAATRPARVT